MIVGPTKLPSDGPHAKRCRGKAGRDSSPLEDEGGRVPKRHGVAAPSTARCETANCRGNAWSVSTNRGGLKPGFVRVRRVNLPERRSATTGQVASKGFSLPNAATSMARGYPASSGRATSAMGISVSVKALRASGSAHSGAITIKSLSRLSERTSEATARHSSTCGNRLEKKTFAPSSSSPKSGIASHKYLAWPVNVRMLIESGVKPRFEARTRAGREMARCPASTPTGECAIQPDRGRPYKNQNGGFRAHSSAKTAAFPSRNSARGRRAAGRRAGFHRHVDLHGGIRLRLERRGEARADLERRVGVRGHDGLSTFERRLDARGDPLELALHADGDLEQGRQVLLERGLELGGGSGVDRSLDLGRDDRRLALGFAVHFGVAVRLALRAHLWRLDLAAALRLLELRAAVARAGAFALALGLHGAGRIALTLALRFARRVGFAGALAVAGACAFTLGVLAVALSVAGAIALTGNFARTFTLAGAATGAFALGAGFHVAGAFALGVALAAQLATFTGDLGRTGLDVGVALAGAVSHRVDGGATNRRLDVDLELHAGLGLDLAEDLHGGGARCVRLLAGALFLRLQVRVGRAQVFGEIAACGSDLRFDVRADLLQMSAGGERAFRLALELTLEPKVGVHDCICVCDVRRTTAGNTRDCRRAGDALHVATVNNHGKSQNQAGTKPSSRRLASEHRYSPPRAPSLKGHDISERR